MKIFEITEKYDDPIHVSNALLAGDLFVGNYDSNVDTIYKEYVEQKESAEKSIEQLETIITIIDDVFGNDEYWYSLRRHTQEEREQLAQDWMDVQDKARKYLNVIKQQHNIREDNADFKASTGQLSPMATNKRKTRRDHAKSEVEQLMRK